MGALASSGIDLGDLPGLTPATSLAVASRCRHVWSENRRVLAALDAMAAGEIHTLGKLLYDAHASARDDYEISCPEIEALVSAAAEVDGVAGARLTGAGWGGCIIALVHADASDEFQTHVAQSYARTTGLTCSIFPCRAGAGAGHVAQV
ncbi:MAG: hypothetical protein HC802_23330 [Caldilineaceae bacterium]|nr:hypothetical protein [Caldilineaceae bacterium]